jgi:hypothetical protein
VLHAGAISFDRTLQRALGHERRGPLVLRTPSRLRRRRLQQNSCSSHAYNVPRTMTACKARGARGAAIGPHRHDHGRALIALTDGRLQVVDGDSRILKTYRWERGRAYWLDADPPGETHADVNNTARPIEVIVVELKQDR